MRQMKLISICHDTFLMLSLFTEAMLEMHNVEVC